ncbi:hypothetical protein niasHS_004755 [Heterodera schachtii]|uniref:Uncharacterized protein n=1 Tax=Heterodera schachtii TaxID=97005 RepID=A0ABD2JZV1_HETSC
MPIINFDRLPAAMRPQRRRLRPLQLFQLVLLSLYGILLFAKLIYMSFSQQKVPDGSFFFVPFLYIIIILCIREVYKGSHGQKWHFHGICGFVMVFLFFCAWYDGRFKRKFAIPAIWAGIMCEFFAYIALNKILSVAEGHQSDGLVNEANKSVLAVDDQI